MITLLAVDRLGALTSYVYKTKSSDGNFRVLIWIVTLSVWLSAVVITQPIWTNIEYKNEYGVVTCRFNFGLPVYEDVGDFVREGSWCNTNGSISWRSPARKIPSLIEIGFNEEECRWAFFGNRTGYKSKVYLSSSDINEQHAYDYFWRAIDSTYHSSDYSEFPDSREINSNLTGTIWNDICGHGLENLFIKNFYIE